MYKINEDLKNVDAFRFGYDPMPVWFLDLFRTEFNNKYSYDVHHVRYANDLLNIETYEDIKPGGGRKTIDDIKIWRGQWVCKYIGTDNKIRVFENEDFKKQFVKYDKKFGSEDIIFTGLSLTTGIIIITIMASFVFKIMKGG